MAKSIAITAGDLSGAWKEGQPHKNDTSGDTAMARCLGIANSDPSVTAYAASPEFTQGATLIYSATQALANAAVVQSDLRGYESSRVASCLRDVIRSSGGRNVTVTQAALPTSAASASGTRLSGSFDLPASQGGGHYLFDAVLLAKNRIETSVHVLTRASTIPAALVDRATAALAQRLNANAS